MRRGPHRTNGQDIDEVGAVGCAPAGAKVVARNRGIIRWAAGPVIIARGGVVEAGEIVGAPANSVEGRVEETNGGQPGSRSLLIDQRGKARPQRRRATGAAEGPRAA